MTRTKKGGKHRKLRPGSEFVAVAEACGKLQRGEMLSDHERKLAANILFAVLNDVDPREIYYESVKNRRVDPARVDRAFWCVIDAERYRRTDKDISKAAAQRWAQSRWRMTEEQMRRAWIAHEKDAAALLDKFADRAEDFDKVIEHHFSGRKAP